MIIIGNRAVGKTTFGKKLSKLLDMPFVDSDEEVAFWGSIHSMFEENEFHFRVLEESTILSILDKFVNQNIIIVLGGGAPMNPNVRFKIKASGHKVLWVSCDETLRQERLKTLNRPNVDDTGRDKIYASLADDVLVLASETM